MMFPVLTEERKNRREVKIKMWIQESKEPLRARDLGEPSLVKLRMVWVFSSRPKFPCGVDPVLRAREAAP